MFLTNLVHADRQKDRKTWGKWCWLLTFNLLHLVSVHERNISQLSWIFNKVFVRGGKWSWSKSKWDFYLLWLTMRNDRELKPIIPILSCLKASRIFCIEIYRTENLNNDSILLDSFFQKYSPYFVVDLIEWSW